MEVSLLIERNEIQCFLTYLVVEISLIMKTVPQKTSRNVQCKQDGSKLRKSWDRPSMPCAENQEWQHFAVSIPE